MNHFIYGGKRPHILIVDDDAPDRELLRSVLKTEADVSEVTNGGEAIAWLAENRTDLMLLEYDMDGLNGLEVLRRMQEITPLKNVPVVLLTSDASDELAATEEGLRIGAVDFIRKPFAPPVLLLRVRRILQFEYLRQNLEYEVAAQTKLARDRLTASQKLFHETVLALAKTIDAKDEYTRGHSERVAKYARQIAERAGESPERQEQIYQMGLLHDIGKIGIPGTIINKTSRLSDEEYAVIKSHTTIGAGILRMIEEFPELSIGARSHHERYDGRGYPEGLTGDAIPKAARMIAVADAYDAMTSTRSYRAALSQAVVRAEIEKGKGSQFDPELADLMLAMIDDDTAFTMHD